MSFSVSSLMCFVSFWNFLRFLPENKKYRLESYKTNPKNICERLWTQSLINWDGSVSPCCHDYDLNYTFGSIIKEKGFKKIWFGDKYINFRKAVLNNMNSIPLCKNCPKTMYNKQFFEI